MTNGNSQEEEMTASRGIDYNVHVCFLQENGRLYVWLSTEAVLDLCNGAVSEKNPQIFDLRCLLST